MSRTHAGVVFDLMTATEAGDGHLGVAAVANRGEQALLADELCDLKVFDFVPERAGHAAAAGVDLSCACRAHLL